MTKDNLEKILKSVGMEVNNDHYEDEAKHIFLVKNFRNSGTKQPDYVLDKTGGLFLDVGFPDNDGKQLFYLCGALGKPHEEKSETSYKVSDDDKKTLEPYIVSLEFVSRNSFEKIYTSVGIKDENTLKRIKFEAMCEELREQPDFLRKKIIIQNSNFSSRTAKETLAYAVFIKIPAVGPEFAGKTVTVGGTIYDVTNLLNYFICSDSRTYKRIVDVTSYVFDDSASKAPLPETVAHNLLIYGAPGTGKSYYIDKQFRSVFYKDYFIDEKDTEEEKINKRTNLIKLTKTKELEKSHEEDGKQPDDKTLISTAQKYIKDFFFTRVTFYEDYSYESFVGCYKPVKTGDKLTYEFEPGPFINMYVKAVKDKAHNYLLAIEEINRAKAAAVFGDLFQVLDRDDEGNSEYSVKPETALDKYLEETLGELYDGTISLPSNLYIWATMNSADQDVYVLDSAFKRRWQFQYMDIDTEYSGEKDERTIHLTTKTGEKPEVYTWDSFRKAINRILKEKYEEDRCIGPWFFKTSELKMINAYMDAEDGKNMVNPLADKLLTYLLQDVVKLSKGDLFEDDYQNISAIRAAFASTERIPIDKIIKIKINELEPYDKQDEDQTGETKEVTAENNQETDNHGESGENK